MGSSKRASKPKGFKRKRPQQREESEHSETEAVDVLDQIDLDGNVGEDDEEIDSDLADTDGEDDFKQPPQPHGINLDESEEEEEGVDLSTMLDQPQSDNDSEDEDALSLSEDDQDGLDALGNFVDNLSSKRKASNDPNQPSKKRRVATDRTELAPESEYTHLKSQKVSVEDLLAAIPASQQTTALKRSLKALQGATTKSKGTLPAPLDSRSQAKLNRAAAKEKLEAEVDKWNDTVSQMKGIGSKDSNFGSHRIQLPLKRPDSKHEVTAAELGSNFKPRNSLEQQLSSILTTSRVDSVAAQTQLEEAAMTNRNISLEEQRARTAELRQQRELLHRAERKAKRIAKIKSKTYRKIARKARKSAGAAEEMSLEELAELDELDGGSRMEDRRMQMEVARAKERATLKHSTGAHGGRWAKETRLLSGLEGNEAQEMEKARREREELLRAKITGDDEQDSDGSGSDLDDDADEEAIKQSAFDELATFEADQAANASPSRQTGLMAMKFMQTAMARKDAEADALASAFRDELEGERLPDSDEEDTRPTSGRMVFAPKAESAITPKATVSQPKSSKMQSTVSFVEPSKPVEVPTGNPWLTSATQMSRKGTKNSSGALSQADKVAHKASKTKQKSTSEREAAREEETVVIDVQQTLGKKSKNALKKAKRKAADQAALDGQAAAPSDSDDDGFELPTAFQQRDLVAQAFANDNVVADFEEEKRRAIEADAPQELDATIPGWGSWGGKGVKKKAARQNKFVTVKPGIDASARKDAKLAHVIISEKRDKKAVKYMIKDLPHPYTSAAQHEQSLRQPLGPEFVTGSVARSLTRPEVLVQAGSLIQPVSLPSS